MKIVIFGLSISSAWGNGHATLWRGLCRELGAIGHHLVFFERDVEYYRSHRDYTPAANCELILYDAWENVMVTATRHLDSADAGIVTSYCPDGIDATDSVLTSNCGLRVFYDLDTPVTLAHVRADDALSYVGPSGYSRFDLVLSYTGGRALDELRRELGAQQVETLYGSVDPEVHHPVEPDENFRADLSYLGTYAEDRQPAVAELLLKPSVALADKRFLIGGSQYPPDFPWRRNMFYRDHVWPEQHAAFYCSSPLTLNVTRGAMAASGWCPPGRLFEAASCGAAVVSDWWEGLDHFYEPGVELFVCRTAEDVIATMKLPESRQRAVAEAARRRTLAEHTAAHRAAEMVCLLHEGLTNKHSFASLSEAPLCGA